MKKISIYLIILFASVLHSENRPAGHKETRSIFSDQELHTGGFSGPVVKISQIGNGVMTLLGGRGAMLINDVFSIGGAGYGMLAHSNARVGHKEESMRFGYGGPSLGFKLFYQSLFHADFFTTFGCGALNFKESRDKNFVFVIDPEVNGELNLFPFLQVGLGLHYRFMFASNNRSLRALDLFGIGGQLYAQFVW